MALKGKPDTVPTYLFMSKGIKKSVHYDKKKDIKNHNRHKTMPGHFLRTNHALTNNISGSRGITTRQKPTMDSLQSFLLEKNQWRLKLYLRWLRN